MQPIELIITLDDEGLVSGTSRVKDTLGEIPGLVDEYGRAFEKSGTATEDAMKKTAASTEKGGLAMKGFRFAAHEALLEIGVGGEAVRVFAHEAENMGSTLGKVGIALGVAATVGMVAFAVVNHLVEAKQKEREELEKETASLKGEVDELYKNVGQTDAATRSSYNLLLAKRELYRFDLKKQIKEETDALKELEEKNIQGMGFLKSMASAFSADYIDKETAALKENAEKRKDQINVQKLKIEADKEELAGLSRPVSVDQLRGIKPDSGLPDLQKILDQNAETRQLDIENQQAYLDRGRQLGTMGLREQLAAELEIWNAGTYEKEQAMRRAGETEDAINKMRATRAIQAETKELYTEKQIAEARKNLEIMVAQARINTISSALDAYIAVTGKQNVAIFIMQKALAMAQIGVDTARAAMAAAAAAAPLGPEAAAAASAEMWSLGKINMAIAAAAAIGQLATGTWQSGGGGGAVGTYSANRVSGQPQATYMPSDYDARHYGTGYRPGEADDRGAVNIHFNAPVYGMDDFEDKVGQAVDNRVRRNKSTQTIIRRYAL